MGSLLYGRKSENIPIDGNNKAPKILPMTHSHRRTPILPNHDVPSEKADKKHAHHVARRAVKIQLHEHPDTEPVDVIHPRSGGFAKDGKVWAGKEDPAVLRK